MVALSDVAALRVRTLGGFAVWRGATPIPHSAWSRRKVLALFCSLLGAPGYRVHREELADRLWPEAGAEAASNNLRVTLHRLRAAVDVPGTSYLRAEADVIALAPFGASAASGAEEEWLDAAAFARAATAALAGRDLAACRAARARYAGDYLPDALYDEWATGRREELRQQYLAVLALGARLTLEGSDEPEAEDWLSAVLAADRCHEGAARRLMQLQARGGRRAEALRVYAGLERALREELGQAPGAKTQAVAAALRTAEPTAAGEGSAGTGRSAGDAPPAAARAAPVQEAFPPPTVSGAPPATPRGNLPAPLTDLVGRVREQDEILALLGRYRLVTLVGPGGVGKTRLALAAAAAVAARHADGAWLVELAGLAGDLDRGAPLIGRAVATALGLEEEPDRPVLATLTTYLQGRRLLLVLDNCEHLVGACAVLAQALLRACPALHILATSRERLEVAGEAGYPVSPLALPDQPPAGAGVLALDALARCESVALFIERALERRPSFALTAENAPAVVQICRRLEGLPLALELAAARLSVLPVAQIAARLDDCCRLLSGGPRAAEARQRSLQGALDWSFGLLAEPERALFRRLSVFAGGWTLAAAEQVCVGGSVERWAVLDLLNGLVNKSLVLLVETPSDAGRYRLLEPVRQYAAEQLAAAGEEAATHARHLAWCLALAEQAAPALVGPEQACWLERLDAEYDNLRAALNRSTHDRALTAPGAQLAAALWRYWEMRGHLGDGRRWLEAAGRSSATPDVRARALSGAGRLAHMQGDYAQAATLFGQCLALRREQQDARGIAQALYNLGMVALDQGESSRAVHLLDESLSLARALGDPWGIFSLTNALGLAMRLRREYARARALFEESLALAEGIGDVASLAIAHNNLGMVAWLTGDHARARASYEKALALHRRLGNAYNIAGSLANLAELAADTGEHGRARALYREALGLFAELGARAHIAVCLDGLARTALHDGHGATCATLLGAAERLREMVGAPLGPDEQATRDRVVGEARLTLGAASYDAAAATGRSLPLERAIAIAQEEGPEAQHPTARREAGTGDLR